MSNQQPTGSGPALSIPRALQVALQHHRAGRLAQAAYIYLRIIEQDPTNADALHLQGMIHHQHGQQKQAIDLIRRAIAINPNVPEYNFNLATVLEFESRLAESRDAFRNYVALKPDVAEAHHRLANVLCGLGNFDEALTETKAALRLKPDLPETLNLRGRIYQEMGRLREATETFESLMRLQPNFTPAMVSLADLLLTQGRVEQAIDRCNRAIAINPELPEAYNALGLAMRATSQIADAIVAFENALRRRSRYPQAANNLGEALAATGRIEDALVWFRTAFVQQPDFPQAIANAAGVLRDQGLLHDAIPLYRKAIALKPNPALHSELLHAVQIAPFHQPAWIFKEHVQWARMHADPLAPQTPPRSDSRQADHRLRVGLALPPRDDLDRLLLPLLCNLNPDVIEAIGYCDRSQSALQTRIATWHTTSGLCDADFANLIRGHEIDVLIDLSGHNKGNRLLAFAQKPAPVQASWLGYPVTTGMRAIDWRITDSVIDPPGSEQFYVEQLLRLQDGAFCYEPSPDSPAVASAPFAANGCITFGCACDFAAVTPRMMVAWGRILRTVAGSRLMIHSRDLIDRQTRAKVHDLLFRNYIPAERLIVMAPGADNRSVLDFYSRIDIALDTSPCNNLLTTLDALWMGVPVITMSADRAASRVGRSILTRLAASELCCDSFEQHEQTAITLANDSARLNDYRQQLRERLAKSSLMDGERFARAFEAAIQNMWRNVRT